MRQIKFRGLTEGGTCVYGDLINYENGRKAIIGRQLSAPGYLSVEGARISPVKAETIGQYTGLKDVNGVEIYEGDLVKKDDDKFIKCGVISFIHGCWMVASKDGDRYFNLHWYLRQAEVIGNIHQNRELLEGDK